MSKAYNRLIKTLQNIFEMDKADLDFGIYRIMNQKRDEINKFLEEDLLPQVEQAFAGYQQHEQENLQQELQETIAQAGKLGAPDPENTDAVQEIKQKLAQAADAATLENDVFSKLHTFFSRYYDKGDFVSLRRYKADTYAIPYEGEEVKLYWANQDQYYIKSSEHFRDYAFTAKDPDDNDKAVRIKLVEADTEKDNVKAGKNEERRFILDEENPLSIEDNALHIHFTYVPPGNQKRQAELNKSAVESILNQTDAEYADWLKILKTPAPTDRNRGRTILEKHLNDYTARNTFDYFIHKDLGGFLNRELDFFIKNEVLQLDDIDEDAFSVTEQQVRKIKILKRTGQKIIRMLAQLEEFQKKLWLKKKFVVETQYCITLDRIPERFYAAIAANEAQRGEWVTLFAIDDLDGYSEPLGEDFLKDNPFLVLDTTFFPTEFKDALLASMQDLDDNLDGLLIHSENFQALGLMQEKYNKSIKCIHIDPPYNTDTSGFLYKNSYSHSSWLAMMHNKLDQSINLLNSSGMYQCHIDENEYERLRLLVETSGLYGSGTLIWDKKNPMLGRKGISTQHEYVLMASVMDSPIYRKNTNIRSMLSKARELLRRDKEVNEKTRIDFAKWVSSNKELSGGEKAYKYIDEEGRIYRLASLSAGTPSNDPRYYIPLIHPLTGEECPVPPTGWSRPPETFEKLISEELIVFGRDHNTLPQIKLFMNENTKRQLSSVISTASRGKVDIQALGYNFPYCHPLSLYEELLGAGLPDPHDITLDYFAGSGTTGHAVVNLNREDGGRRKYIMVEMGKYFDAVTKPRMQKVVYSKDWKNGKPVPGPQAAGEAAGQNKFQGISHAFKTIRLESYEDALNNLRPVGNKQSLLDESPHIREDYMLNYWLDVETTDSPSLLNIDQFEDPFNYKLNIGSGSVGATRPTTIDLVETFNYLIGLTVKTIDVIRDFKVVTGTNPEDEAVLVIWRNIKGKDNAALEAFLDRQGYNPRDTEFEHIYVNGDHTLDDPFSKVRMTEIEFKRLMFDTGHA